MAYPPLNLDLVAYAARTRPAFSLEQRMIEFLEGDSSTESLDGAAFDHINGSGEKADYLLGQRGFVAELKTVNSSPRGRTEQRLRQRLTQPGASIVFGTLGVSKVIENLHDRDDVAKMMVDMAGRAVRRHLQKANEQIGAVKDRLGLHNAGGLLILLNDAEPEIDASAIGYTLKTAFEASETAYPHITNVWAVIESHRIAISGNREGYPSLHLFKGPGRPAQLDFMARMLDAWARHAGSRIERIPHRGDWASMRPIYDDPLPPLRVFE